MIIWHSFDCLLKLLSLATFGSCGFALGNSYTPKAHSFVNKPVQQKYLTDAKCRLFLLLQF